MTAALAVDAPRLRLGLAFAALAACCYGSIPAFVRLAYAGGADALGVMFLRSIFAALWVSGIAWLAGRSLLPPRSLRWTGVTLGLVWLVGAWSYLASFARIPIGLAVTIFYLFPMFVALMSRLWGGERLPRHRVLALGAGFLGVALAVGASYASIDALGVAFAFTAAVCVATNMMLSQRLMRGSNPQAAMLMMTGTASVVLAALAPAIGFHLPRTGLGWFGFVMATLLFAGAISFFYTAINMIGTVRTAMMCNLEPVVATTVAFLVLAEAQGPVQMVGIALVIGAIVFMQVGDRRLGR